MDIHISKKANNVINTFTPREKETHTYLLELYESTIRQIEESIREIEVYKNDNPIYMETIKHQNTAEFRLKYIWQCLQLHVHYNFEIQVLSIRSGIYQDKDNK